MGQFTTDKINFSGLAPNKWPKPGSFTFGFDTADDIFKKIDSNGVITTIGGSGGGSLYPQTAKFHYDNYYNKPVDVIVDSGSLLIPNNIMVGFKVTIMIHDPNLNFGNVMAYREYRGIIKNIGGTTSLEGAVTMTIISQDGFASFYEVNITADDSTDSLRIQVLEPNGDLYGSCSGIVEFLY
jgi:hypothetical protein